MEIIYQNTEEKIPTNVKVISGVIKGLWLGQWERGPAEFKMEMVGGQVFGALCEVEPAIAIQKYTLGRECQVEYFEAKSTFPGFEGETIDVITTIKLGDTLNPNIEPIGPCYFTYK